MSEADPAPAPDLPSLGGLFRGKTHVLPVRVYYEDTDFSGVVYHANYLRYLERGRSDFLRLIGVHHADLWAMAEPLAFSIARMELEFIRPARIDDALEVRTQYTRAGGARLEAAQSIRRGEDELLRAKIFAACINGEGKPRRLPKAHMQLLKDWVAETSDGLKA